MKVFAALVLLGALGSGVRAQEIGLALGAKAPGAQVETLDGKTADLSQYVGKTPVLLEFWATWCGNCRALEPTMKAMHTKYGARVRFVGVAVSVNQSTERVKKYVSEHGLAWTQFYDRKGN